MASSSKHNDYTGLSIAMLFSERLSYKMKRANDWKWVELKGEALDHYYPDSFGDDYLKRVEDNWRLLSGKPMKHFNDNPHKLSQYVKNQMGLSAEGVEATNKVIHHFDTVSPFIFGLLGDQQRRKLDFIVTDSSNATRNYLGDLKEKLLKDYFSTHFVQPAMNMALQQSLQAAGVQDPFSLNNEQRQQIQSDAQKRTEALIPQDIRKLLQTGKQGIHEKQAQELVNVLVNTLGVKFQTDQSLLNLITEGGVVWVTDVVRNKPRYELVDLTRFYTEGPRRSFLIDNNDIFKQVKFLTPGELWDLYSDELNTKSKLEEFDNLILQHLGVDRIRGNKRTDREQRLEGGQFIANIDVGGVAQMQALDLRKRKDNARWGTLLDRYVYRNRDRGDNDKIRVAMLTFLTLRPYICVQKQLRSGKRVWEWHSEHYEFNKHEGDIKMFKKWVPEYYRVHLVGEREHRMFFKKGPVPFQHRSLEDPYEIRSPYTGGFIYKFNRGNYTEVSTPLDRAKRWIHAFNVEMHIIKEREATDIGKVMLMALDAKPEGWSWGKLIEVVRAIKFLPLDLKKAGMTQADLQLFREVDIGGIYDILPRLNFLTFILQKIGESLMSNRSRQGLEPASTSVTNNLQNINRSVAQTSNITTWLDEITTRLVYNLVQIAKKTIKQGNTFMRYALSNASVASVDLDPEVIESVKEHIVIAQDLNESDLLKLGQNVLMPLINSGQVSTMEALRIVWAKNRAEIQNIAMEADMRREMQEAMQKEMAVATQQQMQQYEMDLIKLKEGLESARQREKNATELARAQIRSELLRKGNDVNENQINDYVEQQILDRDLKEIEMRLKDERERLKLKIEEEKVKVQEKAIDAKK